MNAKDLWGFDWIDIRRQKPANGQLVLRRFEMPDESLSAPVLTYYNPSYEKAGIYKRTVTWFPTPEYS
jgi:hypothetical protein